MTEKQTTESGVFERTFVVAAPVERAWHAFVDREGREAWLSPPGHDPIENPEASYPADGFPKFEMKLGEIEEHKRISWSQHQAMPSGDARWLETVVTFEIVDAGTRISITRSGFGTSLEWQQFRESSTLGFDHSLIDLAAYLETGVNVSRHFSGNCSVGLSMKETPAGLRVVKAVEGGFGHEAGMRDGDLLIAVGGAGTYSRSDVWFIQRSRNAGDELEASYVRHGKVLTGRARLSEVNYTETHGYGGA